jgi:hypothetical protein
MSWSENRFPLFLDMRRATRRDESNNHYAMDEAAA